MLDSDEGLLQRYAEEADTDAFTALVKRYSGMVYGTCLRVTRDCQHAEDCSQEVFTRLARNAGQIDKSLHGWLHTTATRCALDLVRRSARRKTYEEQAAMYREHSVSSEWEEMAPYVDEALEGLPDRLRLTLTRHYLEGRDQDQIATEAKVHRTTAGRWIADGLEALRKQLRKAGFIITGMALAALLAKNTATAAPAGLESALIDIGIREAGGNGRTVRSSGTTDRLEAASSRPRHKASGAVVAAAVTLALVAVVTVLAVLPSSRHDSVNRQIAPVPVLEDSGPAADDPGQLEPVALDKPSIQDTSASWRVVSAGDEPVDSATLLFYNEDNPPGALQPVTAGPQGIFSAEDIPIV